MDSDHIPPRACRSVRHGQPRRNSASLEAAFRLSPGVERLSRCLLQRRGRQSRIVGDPPAQVQLSLTDVLNCGKTGAIESAKWHEWA